MREALLWRPIQKMGRECYIGANFLGGCNQAEGKNPVLVLSRTSYLIIYVNCTILWEIHMQT